MPEAYSQTLRSERLDHGPFYVVINRTTRALTVSVDGRSWVLKPGRNPGIPAAVVPYALKQHPRLGTFSKNLGGGESLVGVEGYTPADQLTPIPPGKEHLGAELIDRVANPEAGPHVLESLPERRRVEERNPLAGEEIGRIDMISPDPY